MHSARNTSRRLGPALLTLVLAGALALATACYPANPQSTFGAGGPVAKQQADLFKFIFWIAAGVFVVVEAAVIYFALRFRRKRSDAMPAQTHGNMKLELTWTIVPALILVAIAIPTVKGIYDTDKPAAALGEPLIIEAVGHQWWFEFRYHEQEIITANELHVPIGRPVVVNLHSQDVIHSFWVPKLAGKVDMIPNNDNSVWFQADKADTYLGQCAEFCGIAHAKMRFRVIAHEPDDYEAWVASMHRPPDPAPAQADGRALFAANCSVCHTVDSYAAGGYQAEIEAQRARWEAWLDNPDPESAEAARVVSAPNLTHFGQRSKIGAGLADLNTASLVAWIKDPSSIKQGTRMQAHALVYQADGKDGKADLSDADVDKIAGYLLSLKPGEAGAATPVPQDPVAKGQELYLTKGCAACHTLTEANLVGPGWKGLYERSATRRPGVSADAYIAESVRTPNAFLAPGFPPVMTAFNLSDAEIADLIEYIKTLK